jgi:hypothetical protein
MPQFSETVEKTLAHVSPNERPELAVLTLNNDHSEPEEVTA